MLGGTCESTVSAKDITDTPLVGELERRRYRHGWHASAPLHRCGTAVSARPHRIGALGGPRRAPWASLMKNSWPDPRGGLSVLGQTLPAAPRTRRRPCATAASRLVLLVRSPSLRRMSFFRCFRGWMGFGRCQRKAQSRRLTCIRWRRSRVELCCVCCVCRSNHWRTDRCLLGRGGGSTCRRQCQCVWMNWCSPVLNGDFLNLCRPDGSLNGSLSSGIFWRRLGDRRRLEGRRHSRGAAERTEDGAGTGHHVPEEGTEDADHRRHHDNGDDGRHWPEAQLVVQLVEVHVVDPHSQECRPLGSCALSR